MPMWEKSPEGATFILKLDRDFNKLDLYWEKLLFMCIGEFYGESQSDLGQDKEVFMDMNIIGVGISLRQSNSVLLEVWIKRTSSICHKRLPKLIHQLLQIDESSSWKTYFKNHCDALNVRFWIFFIFHFKNIGQIHSEECKRDKLLKKLQPFKIKVPLLFS